MSWRRNDRVESILNDLQMHDAKGKILYKNLADEIGDKVNKLLKRDRNKRKVKRWYRNLGEYEKRIVTIDAVKTIRQLQGVFNNDEFLDELIVDSIINQYNGFRLAETNDVKEVYFEILQETSSDKDVGYDKIQLALKIIRKKESMEDDDDFDLISECISENHEKGLCAQSFERKWDGEKAYV